jgi:hypothetical protein
MCFVIPQSRAGWPQPRPHPTLGHLHAVIPTPRGGRPRAAQPLVEVLVEILLDGIVTVVRTTLRTGRFERGEHLKVLYGAYSHHGIYAGAGAVIHLSKEAQCVQRTTLERFRDGRCQIWVVASAKRYPGEKIVRRAESQLGRAGYDLFRHNCEHFCSWCRSGRTASRQVERWLS